MTAPTYVPSLVLLQPRWLPSSPQTRQRLSLPSMFLKNTYEFYLGFVGLVQVRNLINQVLDRVRTDFPIFQTMIN